MLMEWSGERFSDHDHHIGIAIKTFSFFLFWFWILQFCSLKLCLRYLIHIPSFPRISEAERRFLYDLKNNSSANALGFHSDSDSDDEEPPQLPPLSLGCRTLPILSLGSGAAGWINKLDALVFCLLLEVPVSDNPMVVVMRYCQQVICNVSDQGRSRVSSQKMFPFALKFEDVID